MESKNESIESNFNNGYLLNHVFDLSKPEYYMASRNYMQVAIDHGWYDPESGKPFNWQVVYSPILREWASSRFWLFFSTILALPLSSGPIRSSQALTVDTMPIISISRGHFLIPLLRKAG